MIKKKIAPETISGEEGLDKAPSGGRKRDRSETERKLREAAVEVFSKYGFDAATTKLVAQTAGINEALINRYFHGKNGLLLAVIEQFIRDEHEHQLDYSPCNTVEDEIYSFCTLQMTEAKIKERGHMMRIVISRVAVDNELRKYMLEQLPIKDGDPRLIERLERLKGLGQLPKHLDSNLIAVTVSGHIFSNMIFGHLIFGIGMELIHKKLKHFVSVYCRGLLVEGK